uniref:ribosomal protein S11 n=1 Tax=Microzonia abyssicola TaxID=217214 RepID=UPI002E78FB5B|nr:ribosomal protein S11 [Syringoderma abyssicola]WBP70375.1 ribosomal protein S11 [Syringoderma abyssicola]
MLKPKPFSKKNQKNIKICVVYVSCTKRNTLCTFVDPFEKKVKTSCSVGMVKESNKEKKDSYAVVNRLGQFIVQKIRDLRYTKVSVVFRGLGIGKTAVMNNLRDSGLGVESVRDTTLVPHNGCRPPKVRRKKFRTRVGFEIKKLLSPGF